jgi:hypothetical protein
MLICTQKGRFRCVLNFSTKKFIKVQRFHSNSAIDCQAGRLCCCKVTTIFLFFQNIFVFLWDMADPVLFHSVNALDQRNIPRFILINSNRSENRPLIYFCRSRGLADQSPLIYPLLVSFQVVF